MGEIKKCAIGKMIHQLNGFAFKSELFNQDGHGTRLCRGINITRGKLRFDDSNEMFWSDDSIDLSKYLLEGGDIVISMDGSLVGRNFALVKENDLPLLLVQRVARLRAKPELCQEYLYQWIGSNHFVRYVDSVKTSSGIPHISASQINDFQIYLPPLPEQQKIAAILSKWDELIETQTQLINTKEKQKISLMQKLLTGEVRFPGFEDEWEYKILEEVLDYEQPTKYIVKSTEYSDYHLTPVLTAGKTFVLGYTDEVDGVFLEKLPVIIFDDFTTANKFVDFPFKVKSSAMKILKAKSSEFNIRYIYEMMQTLWFVPTDHKRYWISQFSQLEIPIPSIEEQNKIEGFSASLDNEIQSLKDELEAIKLQKKGLMQQLLTGKIRVKV